MHFIKLMRPLNLFIIALTMYGLGWCMQSIQENDFQFGIDSLLFFLLVFSTVLIAAAGNIINDYFDMDIDHINKPKKMVIGKWISRRWAMLWHMLLSLIGLFLTADARTMRPHPDDSGRWAILNRHFDIFFLTRP